MGGPYSHREVLQLLFRLKHAVCGVNKHLIDAYARRSRSSGEVELFSPDPCLPGMSESAASEHEVYIELETGVMVLCSEDEEAESGHARKRRKIDGPKRETARLRNLCSQLPAAPADSDTWARDFAQACKSHPELRICFETKMQQTKRVHLYTDWSGVLGGEQALHDVFDGITGQEHFDMCAYKFRAMRATDKDPKCKFVLSSCKDSWAKPHCVQSSIMDRATSTELNDMKGIVEAYQDVLKDATDRITETMNNEGKSKTLIKKSIEAERSFIGKKLVRRLLEYASELPLLKRKAKCVVHGKECRIFHPESFLDDTINIWIGGQECTAAPPWVYFGSRALWNTKEVISYALLVASNKQFRFDVEIYEFTEGVDKDILSEVHNTPFTCIHCTKLSQFDAGVPGIRRRVYGVAMAKTWKPIAPLGGPTFQSILHRKCDKVAEDLFRDDTEGILRYANNRAKKYGPQRKYESLDDVDWAMLLPSGARQTMVAYQEMAVTLDDAVGCQSLVANVKQSIMRPSLCEFLPTLLPTTCLVFLIKGKSEGCRLRLMTPKEVLASMGHPLFTPGKSLLEPLLPHFKDKDLLSFAGNAFPLQSIGQLLFWFLFFCKRSSADPDRMLAESQPELSAEEGSEID